MINYHAAVGRTAETPARKVKCKQADDKVTWIIWPHGAVYSRFDSFNARGRVDLIDQGELHLGAWTNTHSKSGLTITLITVAIISSASNPLESHHKYLWAALTYGKFS